MRVAQIVRALTSIALMLASGFSIAEGNANEGESKVGLRTFERKVTEVICGATQEKVLHSKHINVGHDTFSPDATDASIFSLGATGKNAACDERSMIPAQIVFPGRNAEIKASIHFLTKAITSIFGGAVPSAGAMHRRTMPTANASEQSAPHIGSDFKFTLYTRAF